MTTIADKIADMEKETGKPVFRYDHYMPKTDDVTLIVLRGHLLIEETLVELAQTLFPSPQRLPKKLGFYNLACIVRAADPLRSDNSCWDMILKLNELRNDLAHHLDSNTRSGKIAAVFSLLDQTQITEHHAKLVTTS